MLKLKLKLDIKQVKGRSSGELQSFKSSFLVWVT